MFTEIKGTEKMSKNKVIKMSKSFSKWLFDKVPNRTSVK